MARFLRLLCLTVLAMTSSILAGKRATIANEPPVIRTMSFNIRYGSARDGENHWDRRREALVAAVKDAAPDLLGTQETLDFQKKYLSDHLPEYAAIGVGRDDGSDRGEMTALFFRKDRFEQLDAGHFWLSETPDVPGSISWDSSLTRMCSWVKLRDRRNPDSQPLWFFNTHFDHRGQQARLESAKLLRRKITDLCGNDPVIVTGDFNAGEGSAPYQAFFGTTESGLVHLVDTYRKVHPERTENEGTYNGFRADSRGGGRIDWVASRGLTVKSAGILYPVTDGRPASDHWPVLVEFQP